MNPERPADQSDSSDGEGRAAMTLAELSELALTGDPDLVFRRLAERGCPLEPPAGPWKPLAGGLEYNQYLAGPLRVDGIPSALTVEVTRPGHSPEQAWAGSFDLRPVGADADWIERIRRALQRDFQRVTSSRSDVEIYDRGSVEQSILFHDSPDGPARLLIHSRGQIHNPSEES